MGKIFKILIAIFLILVFVGGAFLVYFFNYLKNEEVVKLKSGGSGNISVVIRDEEKGFLKRIAKKIKEIIYREATEHNPEGDLLPDELDNKIEEEIKSRIE